MGDGVVVTGGGSGIGRATAVAAAAQGLAVSVWDVNANAAAAVADEIRESGGSATATHVDVIDSEAVAMRFAELATSTVPRYLVNNAGPASASTLSFSEGLTATAGSVETVTAHWLNLALPAGASVVNVASVAGTILGVSPAWYSSGKGAITAYTRFLAVQEATRIRANAVAPGLTLTPRMEAYMESKGGKQIQSRVPLGRAGRPEDVAWAILFLLSPRAAYITGVLLPVDGAWTLAP